MSPNLLACSPAGFPFHLVDLTHVLDETVPTWTGRCGFRHETALDYDQCTTPVKFRVQKIRMNAGTGTHMDAPAHIMPGGTTVDQIPLNQCLAPCVVLDVAHLAHESWSLDPETLQHLESLHGPVAPGDWVMVHTGWSRHWSCPDRYHNQHRFPSVSGDVARILVERGIKGLGIDTLSPDRPDDGFPVHTHVLGSGGVIVENVAALEQMPPRGAYVLALPVPARGGTEAPVRCVGLVPRARA
jgi:kynurenine formamidase